MAVSKSRFHDDTYEVFQLCKYDVVYAQSHERCLWFLFGFSAIAYSNVCVHSTRFARLYATSGLPMSKAGVPSKIMLAL